MCFCFFCVCHSACRIGFDTIFFNNKIKITLWHTRTNYNTQFYTILHNFTYCVKFSQTSTKLWKNTHNCNHVSTSIYFSLKYIMTRTHCYADTQRTHSHTNPQTYIMIHTITLTPTNQIMKRTKSLKKMVLKMLSTYSHNLKSTHSKTRTPRNTLTHKHAR